MYACTRLLLLELVLYELVLAIAHEEEDSREVRYRVQQRLLYIHVLLVLQHHPGAHPTGSGSTPRHYTRVPESRVETQLDGCLSCEGRLHMSAVHLPAVCAVWTQCRSCR